MNIKNPNWICFLSVLLILPLVLSSCTNQKRSKFHDAEIVTIDGNPSNLPVQINRKGEARIPIIGLLGELGFEIEWESDTSAVVSILGKAYIISIKEKTILSKDEDDGFNYLMPAPGQTNYFCEVEGNDIVVTNTTIRSYFSLIDYPYSISINVDYKSMTVSIETPNLTT